jgi:hypothetical protein
MKECLARVTRRLRDLLASLAGGVAKVGSSIFGRILWNPPRWLSRTMTVAAHFHRARPRFATGLIIAAFVLSCGAAWGWHWYQNQPKPRWVTGSVRPIPLTTLRKDGSRDIHDLIVKFSQSAARLEDLKKDQLQGVQLEPRMAGNWHWANDDLLIFSGQPKIGRPIESFESCSVRTFFRDISCWSD